MADIRTAPRGSAPIAVHSLHAYIRLVWTWSRAMAQYPASLLLLGISQAAGILIEMAAVVVVFLRAGSLGGFTVHEALLIYGLAGVAFSLADLSMGSVERLGGHIRTGGFDAMLLRPVSPLAQLAADEFSPRRLGKLIPSIAALAYACAVCDIDWTPLRVLMLALFLTCGTVICCALWVSGSCIQFFIIDAGQAANSLTYGGKHFTEYPLAIFGPHAVRLATFVVPMAFIGWQPALYLLDRPDPTGLPDELRYAAPAVALLMSALAALIWRTGLRHYRSTGS